MLVLEKQVWESSAWFRLCGRNYDTRPNDFTVTHSCRLLKSLKISESRLHMSKSLAVALPEFSSRSVKGMFLQLSLLGGPYILPLSALHIAHTFCICERSSEVHHWLSSHMLNCTHFPMSSEATARSRRTPPCPKSWEPTPPTPQNKENPSNGFKWHPLPSKDFF